MLFTNTYIIGVINMRRLLLLVTMLVTVTTSAQIKDFFKYSTIYGTAIINQPVQDPYGDWFIPRDWTIQPQPIQNQNEYNYNYSIQPFLEFDLCKQSCKHNEYSQPSLFEAL